MAKVLNGGCWRLCAEGIDDGTAWQGLGWWWAGQLGFILALFSPPPAFPLLGLVPLSGYLCGLRRRRLWRMHEVKVKAWTTTSTDVVPSLQASFTTSLPTMLDFAGENLPSSDSLLTLLALFPS
jgi:hypothetical protein